MKDRPILPLTIMSIVRYHGIVPKSDREIGIDFTTRQSYLEQLGAAVKKCGYMECIHEITILDCDHYTIVISIVYTEDGSWYGFPRDHKPVRTQDTFLVLVGDWRKRK